MLPLSLKGIKVSNMMSKSGREVPNQFIIQCNEGTIFQSYNSIICFSPNKGPLILGPKWDYSNTTSKYRSEFLGESTKDTRDKLNRGKYILDDTL